MNVEYFYTNFKPHWNLKPAICVLNKSNIMAKNSEFSFDTRFNDLNETVPKCVLFMLNPILILKMRFILLDTYFKMSSETPKILIIY